MRGHKRMTVLVSSMAQVARKTSMLSRERLAPGQSRLCIEASGSWRPTVPGDLFLTSVSPPDVSLAAQVE